MVKMRFGVGFVLYEGEKSEIFSFIPWQSFAFRDVFPFQAAFQAIHGYFEC